jgi:transposase
VVERTFAWLSRARRLARDYERLPRVAVGLHFAACLSLLLARAVAVLTQVGNSL